jgi:kinesin family protein 6/9
MEDLPKVTVMDDGAGDYHMTNLSQTPVTNEEDALNSLFIGDTNRMIAETPMNQVRCAFFGINLYSRMPLVPTPARLKLLHACDQYHSSWVFTPLTGSHCKLCRNTVGLDPIPLHLFNLHRFPEARRIGASTCQTSLS